MRAARLLGLRTVALHASDDAGAGHLAMADEAVVLAAAGPGAYLDVDAVVTAALQAGVDLVHPGWGFLAEHAGMARRCAAAGLIFVGPSPDVLELFGDKVAARTLAARAVCPWPRAPTGRWIWPAPASSSSNTAVPWC
jgi:acetyl/propionyl-CoA carboxylase alpha subunit